MAYLMAVALGYLLGCSNMAWYIAKMKKVNFRDKGSGNLGASNTTLLLGWQAGILVALHDVGKAIASVLVAGWLFPDVQNIGAAAGVACVLGHIFPFWLKFRGGKGFASFLGMTIALNWKLAIVVIAAVVVVTVITDYIVLGTFTAILVVPAWEGYAQRSIVLPLILLIATAVIFYKHRENIPRMLNRTELGLRNALRGDKRVK